MKSSTKISFSKNGGSQIKTYFLLTLILKSKYIYVVLGQISRFRCLILSDEAYRHIATSLKTNREMRRDQGLQESARYSIRTTFLSRGFSLFQTVGIVLKPLQNDSPRPGTEKLIIFSDRKIYSIKVGSFENVPGKEMIQAE